MSLLERVYSFHQDLLQQRYPNATILVDRFEVSLATARRDIAYLRDRLMAPLAFDNRKNGFYYTEDDFSLPFNESPKITLLLGMLNRFAEEAGLRELPEVQQLEKKLSSMLSADHAKLLKSLYCEWIQRQLTRIGLERPIPQRQWRGRHRSRLPTPPHAE
jgi:predicted DNA-binding transcriptional regulator YafY